ncbi:unnamed protein product [Periconia digitata]|uniref:Defective in cullin neddylation protein n=1 Tax=Periconia digitata TaxID=1303443 RepID=A0A9W4XUL1_9PLEO|nr:unnamed protein product [Periconia digitata]
MAKRKAANDAGGTKKKGKKNQEPDGKFDLPMPCQAGPIFICNGGGVVVVAVDEESLGQLWLVGEHWRGNPRTWWHKCGRIHCSLHSTTSPAWLYLQPTSIFVSLVETATIGTSSKPLPRSRLTSNNHLWLLCLPPPPPYPTVQVSTDRSTDRLSHDYTSISPRYTSPNVSLSDAIMPSGYNTQQRNAIQQFQQFSQADRNMAVRFLKSANWDPQAAVNAFFSSNGNAGGGASTAMKNNLTKMFDAYREDPANAPDTVGTENTMNYFGELGVEFEDLDVLIASELIQAPTMGEMSREGFVNGWSAVNCDTLDKQKAHIKFLKQTLPADKDAFTKVYKYTFLAGKTGGQKAVALDTAITFWELLFSSSISHIKWNAPGSPWLAWWKEFLESKWKKSVNRDMWNQTLKFAELTLEDETMGFWNEDSSWPSVIDEFVEWVKMEKRGGSSAQPDAMEY